VIRDNLHRLLLSHQNSDATVLFMPNMKEADEHVDAISAVSLGNAG
jgi:hypothetical protein